FVSPVAGLTACVAAQFRSGCANQPGGRLEGDAAGMPVGIPFSGAFVGGMAFAPAGTAPAMPGGIPPGGGDWKPGGVFAGGLNCGAGVVTGADIPGGMPIPGGV